MAYARTHTVYVWSCGPWSLILRCEGSWGLMHWGGRCPSLEVWGHRLWSSSVYTCSFGDVIWLGYHVAVACVVFLKAKWEDKYALAQEIVRCPILVAQTQFVLELEMGTLWLVKKWRLGWTWMQPCEVLVWQRLAQSWAVVRSGWVRGVRVRSGQVRSGQSSLKAKVSCCFKARLGKVRLRLGWVR